MDGFNPYKEIKVNDDSINKTPYAQCEQLVNEIYLSLVAIFKGCWVSQHQEDINAYKKQLFLAFQQFKISTQEQIEDGLKNARNCNPDRFPNVKQIVDWCLNADSEPETRPQKDTRPDWMMYQALESDERKARKKEIALNALKGLKKMLLSIALCVGIGFLFYSSAVVFL
jgi:hypothetical protein